LPGLLCEDQLGNSAATQTRTITVEALCPAPSFLCSDDSCADGSVSPAICGVSIEEEFVGALAVEVFPADDVNTNPPLITLLPAQDVCKANPNCEMAVLEDPDDATKLTFIMVRSIMQGETYVDAGVMAFDIEDGDLTAEVAAYGRAWLVWLATSSTQISSLRFVSYLTSYDAARDGF